MFITSRYIYLLNAHRNYYIVLEIIVFMKVQYNNIHLVLHLMLNGIHVLL